MGKNFNFKKPNMAAPSQGAANAELAKMLGVSTETAVPHLRQIEMLKIEFLDTHPLQHCYSMNEDELDWLAENVRQNGVMEPIHVQAKANGRYTIIAGHRRTEASRRAGLTEIPAIVEQLDEDSAVIMFDSTNLGQRRSLSPGERAAAYMRIEKAAANKALDQRKTTAIISEITGDHVRTIHRYKRLNYLIPEFLKRVDTGVFSFLTGVELSYLPQSAQEIVLETLTIHNKTALSESKAKTLKELSKQNVLDSEQIELTLFPPKKETVKTIKLPISDLEQFLPVDMDKKEILQYIIDAVAAYSQQ